MESFKQGVADSMLFCASRIGDVQAISQLVAGNAGKASQVNVVDDFGRSPLYWAVQVSLICLTRTLRALTVMHHCFTAANAFSC